MDINLNVNVKIEETPALIKCLSTFCGAIQSTVEVLALAANRYYVAPDSIEFAHSDSVTTEAVAPAAKKSRTGAKKENATPAAAPVSEVPQVSQPESPKITETVDYVDAMLAPEREPEAVKELSLEDVKAVCMDFAKANPDKKANLAECFKKVGATKLSDTDPAKYAELVKLVKAL